MDWLAGGVDMSISNYSGPDCIDYINLTWRRIETVLMLMVCLYLFRWSYPKSTLPTIIYNEKDQSGKRILLVSICLCWGMEIGFKCASKTLIYLLNPCHVTTAMQIYLLAAKPSKLVTAVFRIHFCYLNGPLLAMVLYETRTRLLPLEAEVYWIQHAMMFVIPYYLLRLGGVYNVEPIKDFHWTAMAFSFLVAYHFTVLQGVSILTNINMNFIMCPVDADPFRGQFYRSAGFFHEAMLCVIVSKTYIFAAEYFLTKFKYTRVKDALDLDIDLVDDGEKNR